MRNVKGCAEWEGRVLTLLKMDLGQSALAAQERAPQLSAAGGSGEGDVCSLCRPVDQACTRTPHTVMEDAALNSQPNSVPKNLVDE